MMAQVFDEGELWRLLDIALTRNDARPLEQYLTKQGTLANGALNMSLVDTFAGLIAQIVVQPEPPVARLEELLDGWAAQPVTNDVRAQLFPTLAAASYGQVALARPDWRDDELRKLNKLAVSSSLALREMVLSVLQRILYLL